MMPFTFLVCSERSGSNFLTSLLNGHPEVSGPPPTHLFRLFATNRGHYGDLEDDESWTVLVDDVVLNFECKLGLWSTSVTGDDLRHHVSPRTLAWILRFVYEREANHDRAGHIFVKENHTARFAPFLLASFPNCRFVWLVRDPRDVAASWFATSSIPGGVERAVEVWLADQEDSLALAHQLADSQRMIRVTYEDLVADPAIALQRITSFLGLSYDDAMLEAHDHDRTRANAARIDAWANLMKPVIRDNTGSHRKVLTAEERQYVEIACGDLMQRLGYRSGIVDATIDTERRDRRLEELRPALRSGNYLVPSDSEREIRLRRLAAIQRVLDRGKLR